MSASISTKKKNIGMEFLKAAAGHITGAVGEYITDAMPITDSTIKGAKSTINEFQASFASTSSSILPKMRQLNVQSGFRGISNWFLQKEDDGGLYGDIDSQLDFDVDTDHTEIAQAQISEIAKNANQVSNAVIESSHKLVESQIAATANMLTSIDRQTAVISSGFDNTNETLGKILEVLTKNSATLIEATVAANSKQNESHNDNMIASGKFDISNYKKMVGKNFQNSEIGMVASMIPMFIQMGKSLTPQDLIKMGLDFGIGKAAPNMKKNMKAVDDAVNETIMTSLIRLGERKHEFGPMGAMAKLFGLDSTRKTADTRRSSLEVKSVPFDTITKEAVTNAIPGYLRKILVAVGGNDMVYDYRSRSFKNGTQIKKEYRDMSASKYNIHGASKGIQKAVGTDDFGSMLYDLMMNELGSRAGAGGDARNVITNFKDKDFSESFILDKVLKGIPLSPQEKSRAKQIAANLAKATDGFGAGEMMNQVSRNNVVRNERTTRYINQADTYGMDLSDIRDSVREDAKNIAAEYGKSMVRSADSDISSKGPTSNLKGVNYTNMALYEIYRRLNEGINVFQVGHKNIRDEKFKKFGDDYLTKPGGYKPKSINDASTGTRIQSLIPRSSVSGDESPNLLENQEGEDGNSENLSKGQRFARWGKKRGGTLAKAVFSGSPEEVRDAFGSMMKDVTEIGGAEVKKGLSQINSSFGNISGYLKHKMFGTEYSYQTGVDETGNPVMKNIAANEKKGVFGWIKDSFGDSFKDAKKSSSKWLSSVKGYFDFGDDEKDPADRGVAGKRKKLLVSSIGAFAGAGILGGPIGLIVGALAGNAISSLGFGKKIKGFLFGHDDKGKPTGLLTKAADAIISPIKFQLGKTISFAGGILKKNVFGPLADIGLALKDRMTNHIDSMFKKASDFLLKPFKELGKRALGGIVNLAGKAVTGLTSLSTTTIPGKLVRGAIGIGGGLVGGLQGGIARGVGKNSFHTLKKDEEYVIKAGEAYLGKDGKKHTATEDMTVTGNDGLKVSTNAYNKMRRKNRSNEVENDLKESGYYQSGRGVLGKVKGFFGGDYKKWHEQDQLRSQERRNKLGSYLSEEEDKRSPAEIAEATKKTEENTAEIAGDIGTLSSAIIGEIIPGSSFKSHDEGVHELLREIIDIISPSNGIKTNGGIVSESTKLKNSNTSGSDMDSFTSGALGAAATLAGSGDDITSEESRLTDSIIDNAMKPKSSKETIGSKLKDLMGIQKKKKEGDSEGDKKKSLIERIFDTVNLGFSSLADNFGSIAVALGGILGISELKSFWSDVVKGDMNFSEWWGEKSIIGKGVMGLMDISKFVGNVGGPIVNGVSNGISALTQMIPFMPTISPPQINTSGPFAGLATGILGGLYLKGASALGSIASAAASLISAGSNALGGGKGLGKYAGLAAGALALGGSAVGWAQGGYKHEQTDAAGNEIIDQSKQGAYDSTSLKYVGHTMMGTINPISGKSSMAGKYFNALTPPPSAATSMMSATGKTINNIDNVWKYADSGRTVSVSNLAKATPIPNASTVANAADSKGAIGFVKKALVGIKNFLMKNKAVKAFSETIGKKIDDVLSSIVKGGQTIFQKAVNKVAGIITRGTVKEVSSAATLGIGYAVMAFGGALSGGLSAANIFGVRESDVNGIMRTVASVVVAMLNGVPGLWALELADLVLEPLLGITVRSFICELLYGLLGGSEDLEQKKETFGGDLSSYNEQYGAQLSNDEYNDLTNKGMFAKIFGKGSVKTDENGRAMFDDAGVALRTNHGISGWFSGGENEYAKDANGAVLKGEDGKAIQAMDKDGHKMKKDSTWTDHVGNWFHDVGGFLGGKSTYKTDENGIAIIGEDGKAVVENKEGNVFQRGGAAISNWWNGTEVIGSDGNTTKSEGFADAAKKTLGGISTAIAQPFKDVGAAISSWWKSSTELDENGKPIPDENGKSLKKGKIGDYIKSSLGKISSSIMAPVQEMSKGIMDWASKEAPWLADGVKNAADWIGSKATSLWGIMTGNTNNSTTSHKTHQKINVGGIGGGSSGTSGETNNTDANSSSTTSSSTALPSPFLGSGFRLSAGPEYSQYGWRNLDASLGGPGFHKGIDLAPTSGDGSIGAVAPGRVVNMSNSVSSIKGGSNFGNFVQYETADGTRFMNAHMAPNTIPAGLQINSPVEPGDKIGQWGTTGNSSGNHLHFEVSNESFPSDGYNTHTTNPAPLLGAQTVNNTGKYTSGMMSGSSDWSGSPNSNLSGESNSSGKNKTGFALFIERLKEFGNGLLYKITGGLLGSIEEPDEPSTSTMSVEYGYKTADGQNATLSGDGPSSAVSQLNPDVEIELLTNSQIGALKSTHAIAVILDLRSGISYQIEWGGPPKSTHTDYTPLTPADTEKKKAAVAYDGGTWPSWSPRPCILKMDGHQIAIGTHDYPHGRRIGGDPGDSMPNMEDKRVGDEWPLGGHFCMYYKDSLSNSNGTSENAVEHQKAAQEAYNIATAMMEEVKKAREAAGKVKDGDKSTLWAYLKTKGFSDTAISGILGCWDAESKNTAKTIESDYLVPGGPDYDKLINDRQAMNDYTKNVVFAKNPNIDKKWYDGHDKNLYPGIGYAQWTGTRGQELIDYAKSTGKSWAAPVTQLDFMDKELRDKNGWFGPNHLNVLGELSAAKTPEESARVWALQYERATEGHLPPRIAAAKRLYGEYSGKFDDTVPAEPPVGGGNTSSISSVQSYAQPTTNRKIKNVGGGSNIGSQSYKSRVVRGIGGGSGKNSSSISTKSGRSIAGSTNYDNNDLMEGIGGDILNKFPQPITTSGKTQQVELLLSQVIELLRGINNNTGESSDLLESLNQKDFVDKGLRDSISSLPKSKKKTPTPYNHGNTRTISSMARP